MKLSERQQLHSFRVGLLLNYLPFFSLQTGKKYTVAIADAQSQLGNNPKHSLNPLSFHFKKLAIDLDLFIDGVYQRSTKAHKPLGEFWVFIGGTWGGNLRKPDGNHYSSYESR